MGGGHWWDAFVGRFNLNVLLSAFLGEWGQLGVGVFIVISAYFLCDRNGIHSIKVFELCLETVFLNFIAGVIYLVYYHVYSGKAFLNVAFNAILSPVSGQYWFITPFLFLYLLVPFFQSALLRLKEKNLKTVLIILLITVSVADFLYIRAVGAIMDFIVMFILTAYVKLYKSEWMDKHAWKIFVLSFGLIYGLSMIVSVASVRYPSVGSAITRLFVNWNILIYGVCISLFWIFKNLRIDHSRLINLLAGSSFGIYLLHENMYMGASDGAFLWTKIFQLNDFLDSPLLMVKLLASGIIVYFLAFVIDVLRRFTVERLFFKRRAVQTCCNKVDSKISIS